MAGDRLRRGGYGAWWTENEVEEETERARAPGKTTLVEARFGRSRRRRTAPPGAKDREVNEERVRPGSGVARPLPDGLRARLEESSGADLAGVRLHEGPGPARAARSIGARAYAVGQDIYFADGELDPSSAEGTRLIAHEVAHTVQQSGGRRAQAKLAVSSPKDAHEAEADAFATAFIEGRRAPPLSRVAGGLVSRDADDSKASGEDEEKGPPDWLGKKLDFKVAGKGFSIGLEKGLSASMKLAEVQWPSHKDLFGNDKGWSKGPTWSVPVAPGLGFKVSATLSGGLAVSASAKISGETKEYPGPWVGSNEGLSITAGGEGKIESKLRGELSAGGFVGAPYANVALEGFLALEAAANAGFGLFGGVEVSPDNLVNGMVLMTVPLGAELKGSGGAKITYEAVITSGEIAKWELASVTLAKATIAVVAGYDFEQEKPIEDIQAALQWMPKLPEPTLVERRKMTEAEKKKYRAIAAEEERLREGGSGSGPGVPPEAFEDAEPENVPNGIVDHGDDGPDQQASGGFSSLDDAPPPQSQHPMASMPEEAAGTGDSSEPGSGTPA